MMWVLDLHFHTEEVVEWARVRWRQCGERNDQTCRRSLRHHSLRRRSLRLEAASMMRWFARWQAGLEGGACIPKRTVRRRRFPGVALLCQAPGGRTRPPSPRATSASASSRQSVRCSTGPALAGDGGLIVPSAGGCAIHMRRSRSLPTERPGEQAQACALWPF